MIQVFNFHLTHSSYGSSRRTSLPLHSDLLKRSHIPTTSQIFQKNLQLIGRDTSEMTIFFQMCNKLTLSLLMSTLSGLVQHLIWAYLKKSNPKLTPLQSQSKLKSLQLSQQKQNHNLIILPTIEATETSLRRALT